MAFSAQVMLRKQQQEMQLLRQREEWLRTALEIASTLIPKEAIPHGVGSNVVPWLINQAKKEVH